MKDNIENLLTFEVTGLIREIPLEARGISKNGVPWTRGGIYLEVFDEFSEGGSVPLYLTVWGDELVEHINTIGVGKKVRVKFHITSRRSPYGQFSTNVNLETINGMTENEDFVYGTNKKKGIL